MLCYKRLEIDENIIKISNNILNWGLSNDRFLNLISVPYNSTYPLIKLILNYTKLGKKIIYITNEHEGNIKIINDIKRNTDFRNYLYIRNKDVEIDKDLTVCNYENATKINKKFDLVVYDDVNSLTNYDKHKIIGVTSRVCNNNGKIVFYAIESILKNKRDIILPIRSSKVPLVEPRIITTKINLNKDIPFVIYEYLKWYMRLNKKVIIYVPNEEKMINVYKYISEYCKDLCNNINYFSDNKDRIKVVSKFTKIKKGIFITDYYNDFFSEIKNTNIMVLFSDDKIFGYKKLVYFCGRIGRDEKNSLGEVLFLATRESADMDKAKDITRNFNKEAWKMGFLNV